MTPTQKEALIVLGGALLVALAILAYTLLTRDKHLLPQIYPVL